MFETHRGLRALIASLLLTAWAGAARASAQYAPRDDPYAYDLRVAVFPVAFQAGVSQTHVASAVRAEADLSRRFMLQVAGRVPWLALAGQTDVNGLTLRGTIAWNFVDEAVVERLGGTVYPEDTPLVGEQAGLRFDQPTSQKLGGPRLQRPDVDLEARAAVRNVQSIRLGYDFVRNVERGRPNTLAGQGRYFENTFHALHAGYAWGSHWNLSPASVGKAEVGFRRFFIDALLTLDPVAEATPLDDGAETTDNPPKFFPVGLRVGMEGAIAALLRRPRGVGFGYSLELGALPGTSGLEGYLFVGLGLELDLMLRPRRQQF